jgi:hypothetical protein
VAGAIRAGIVSRAVRHTTMPAFGRATADGIFEVFDLTNHANCGS